jgi:hypothetical protein
MGKSWHECEIHGLIELKKFNADIIDWINSKDLRLLLCYGPVV